MDTKNERSTLRRKVISAVTSLVAVLTLSTTFKTDVSALTVDEAYTSYQSVIESDDNLVPDLTWEEYCFMLYMTMAESGYYGNDEMMNGCASAAVNQYLTNGEGESLKEILTYPGRFSFKFCDDDGVWRSVKLADVNSDVMKNVNKALVGDVYENLDGVIGFYAPQECLKSSREYMEAHVSGTTDVTVYINRKTGYVIDKDEITEDTKYFTVTVVFFREWIN